MTERRFRVVIQFIGITTSVGYGAHVSEYPESLQSLDHGSKQVVAARTVHKVQPRRYLHEDRPRKAPLPLGVVGACEIRVALCSRRQPAGPTCVRATADGDSSALVTYEGLPAELVSPEFWAYQRGVLLGVMEATG